MFLQPSQATWQPIWLQRHGIWLGIWLGRTWVALVGHLADVARSQWSPLGVSWHCHSGRCSSFHLGHLFSFKNYIFVKYTHILFGRSHNSTSPIGHCDVFAMLHSSIFLPSKCFMHLRIYQGTKYYADTGKRYRDSSNRRRAGVKHLGHVSFTFGFILSDFVLYIWYPFVCSGTRGPRQTEQWGSSRELRCMPFHRQLTSFMLRRLEWAQGIVDYNNSFWEGILERTSEIRKKLMPETSSCHAANFRNWQKTDARNVKLSCCRLTTQAGQIVMCTWCLCNIR